MVVKNIVKYGLKDGDMVSAFGMDGKIRQVDENLFVDLCYPCGSSATFPIEVNHNLENKIIKK